MAKKKPPPKTLRKPEAALSGLGIGSIFRIVLLAALGIGGSVGAIWIHYRPSGMFLAPDAGATSVRSDAGASPATSSSDGIEYIDIDLDATVLP